MINPPPHAIPDFNYQWKNWLNQIYETITGVIPQMTPVALDYASAGNSWVDFGSGFQVGEYWKDTMGVVHVTGYIKSGTDVATIATLPPGYRPAAHESFAVTSSVVLHSHVVVQSGGELVITLGGGASNAYVSLAGIRFRAA